MRVAVLGSGFMGEVHARAFKEIEDVELVGIFTKSENNDNLTPFNCNIYDSVEKLIKEENPDVVSVCLPSYLHKEYVIQLADLGVHVICEKPIALTLADAREMMAACEANNVRLFIGHVLRFFPEYMQLTKSVRRGDVGNIGVLHGRRTNTHPGLTSAWYNDDSKSGGALLDLVIHDLDFMRYLNGEVRSIFARNQKRENIDFAMITLQFENDAVGNVEVLWGPNVDFEYSFEVYGSEGIIHLTNERQSIQLKGTSKKVVENSSNGKDPYYLMLKHFINCIQEEIEPIVTSEDAYEAIKLSLAATESTRIGKPIELNKFFGEIDRGRD